MYFLKEQFQCLLISLAAALYFLLKFSPQVKAFPILTCIYTNLELQLIGCNQAKYVGRGTCLEWLSPLGKSSASLGMSVSDFWHGIVPCKTSREVIQGVGKHLVTSGVA